MTRSQRGEEKGFTGLAIGEGGSGDLVLCKEGE